ncbi:MAG: DEAD/DEAH box helicase [Myxococcales bacterium]|nr:DEAD/DEAH box helicase [Myxococcales bacterium]
MNFEVGSLVRARGREWVVLPESRADEDMLVLRPLGGTDDEVTGVYLPLEPVEPATFPLPDPAHLGNHLSCSLLRDAVRLGFRSGAGPFRSLSRIRVEPRPYQLVPLLMALRLDPVRLLVADDVGVGKTIEACLIARELLDRAEIRRVAVLCPPHLAEQWQRNLLQQFHIDAALVLAGTAARLERECGLGESLFDRHPHAVVSTDYIKSDRRRDEFLRACPELVIVDEAHTCATAEGRRSGRQQRHELLKGLTKREDRHLVLVTATPHSGNEETFRSLLTLLDPQFRDLPQDLSGEHNRKHRSRLAQHFVQRRRADLEAYLDIETPFPRREIAEEHYNLTREYRAFFDRVLAYCRERVTESDLGQHHQRVRWWSALALLRALASSPRAAAETLRNRAASAATETVAEADDVGRRTVLDLEEESIEGVDVIPGSQTESDDDEKSPERRRLLKLAREVEKLAGKSDAKLQRACELVEQLLKDGHAPILFCRFIPTVDYVAEALRKRLKKKVTVEAITGTLPPEEREQRVEALGAHDKRVLVCTDCLSEGINLQQHFDAVVHYDLSWNPTRHEQREGRVDRYGQARPSVRTLTYYGADNPVDGFVLEVLLRKHKSIHKQLGIIVPVPLDTNVIIEAIFEGLLLKKQGGTGQMVLPGTLEPTKKELDVQWDAAVDRERRSRTIFAQRTIKVEDVSQELAATRHALGDDRIVEEFTRHGLRAVGATLSKKDPLRVDLAGTNAAVRDALGEDAEFTVSFRPPEARNALLLTRTHPVVEGLATHVLETALDALADGVGRRCGVVRTASVGKRTTLLLLRMRYHIVTRGRDGVERPLLAEDHALVGFRGAPAKARWLAEDELLPLLEATPSANTPAEIARQQVQSVIDGYPDLRRHLDDTVKRRGDALLEAHRRVRKAARLAVRSTRVQPHFPADVLGIFVYLPVAGGAA